MTMDTKTLSCPKCIDGLMILEEEEYDEEWACINCGERRSLNQMEEIMQENKQEEKADSIIPEPEQEEIS